MTGLCGISAIVRMQDARPGSRDELLAMHDLLEHRGPDGEGFLTLDAALAPSRFETAGTFPAGAVAEARLAIAFRRLRILDLNERADQPLTRPGDRRFIVLNGEIYNFAELRDELRAAGETFATTGDTEVALAAYERWGVDAFRRFNGMWSLLIVDLQRGVIVGCRDRLGIKPLFYAVDGDRLLFASEPKAIAAVQRGGARYQPYRLHEFLRGFPPQSSTLSFFDGVHPVPSATYFEIDLRDPKPPRFQRYWDPAAFRDDAPSGSEARRTGELLSLLRSAVDYEMVADVKVGALLSGGLDSSVLTRMMATSPRCNGLPPLTFSLTHRDLAFDETLYIDAMLAMGGLDGRRELVESSRAFELAPEVVNAQGQPLLGFDLIGHYRMFQFASEHGIKVVLEGQGADEIFGGYPFYEPVAFRDRLRHLQLRDALADIRALSRKYARPLPRLLASYVLGPLVQKLRRHKQQTYPWLDASSTPPAPAGAVANEGAPFASALNRLLYEQTVHTNLPAVLLHQDRNSMAHGVESRVPYLDHRIVEFAFALHPSFKVIHGDRKKILRDVARPLLPALITDRKDKRAIVSSNRWIDLRAHATAVRDAVRSPALANCPLLIPGRAAEYVDAYMDKRHGDDLGVWRLVTAAWWLEAFKLAPGA